MDDIAKKLANLTSTESGFTSHEVALVNDVIQNIASAEDVLLTESIGTDVIGSVNQMLNVSLDILVHSEVREVSVTR